MNQLVRLKVRLVVENGQLVLTERSEEPLCNINDEELVAFLVGGVEGRAMKNFTSLKDQEKAV